MGIVSDSVLSVASKAEIRILPIAAIRRDGQTQHRVTFDQAVVAEYADSMRHGVTFPPIAVRWDGKAFWLSDGFQRVAAAERASLTEILAQVRSGSLDDAKWDSYAANATHGVRRTVEETELVVRRALQHPNAALFSNVELAKHLHLSEPTLRRWRKKLSSSRDEDVVRLVKRGSSTYQIEVRNIGKTVPRSHGKSRADLLIGIQPIKENASPRARRMLNIISNWAFGSGPAMDFLNAVERLLREGMHERE